MADVDNRGDVSPVTLVPANKMTNNALIKFSVNNPDLEQLESLIEAFNPFKILGVRDFEIRHSNVLAWLLDPSGHHGLGDMLFKNLLLEILKDNEGNGFPELNDIISTSFPDLLVMREWRNIDILAISPANKIAMVIENKIYAIESEGQLSKYEGIVAKKYPGYKKVLVFLTLDRSLPQGNDLYIPFTHEQIYKIVKSNVELWKDYINSKVYDFIQQYLQVLEEKTMQDGALVTLCEKLYDEHKIAIETILKLGKPRLTYDCIKDFHKNTDTTSVHMDKATVKKFYTFIPVDWEGIVPTSNVYTDDKYLVFLKFNFTEYEKNKVIMSLIVGNFRNKDKRKEFIEKVNEEAKGLISPLTLKIETTTSTTVLNETILFEESEEWEDGTDKLTSVVKILTKNYEAFIQKPQFQVVDKVVKDFNFNDTGK